MNIKVEYMKLVFFGLHTVYLYKNGSAVYSTCAYDCNGYKSLEKVAEEYQRWVSERYK